MGLKICKPDTHVRGPFNGRADSLTLVTRSNKAVAVGAVSFYVDRFVTGRISKFTYGVPGTIPYQPSDPEHVVREYKMYVNPAGEKRIPNRFWIMLSRVCHPPPFADPPRQAHYATTGHQGSGGPGTPTSVQLCNCGRPTATGPPISSQVHWYGSCPRVGGYRTRYCVQYQRHCGRHSDQADKCETLCSIQVDISTAPYATRRGYKGVVYHIRDYEVILLVGLTELKARVGWIDSTTVSPRGVLSRSPPLLISVTCGI